MPAVVTKEEILYQIRVLNGQHDRGDISTPKYQKLKSRLLDQLENASSFLLIDRDMAETLADRLQAFRDMLPSKVGELITELGLENLLKDPSESFMLETEAIIAGIFKLNELERALNNETGLE
jgi:ribosome assembly protein YihI (activator of Der GTPase)